MKRFHKHFRALIPALVIGVGLIASCWGRLDGARASLPAMSAKREPVNERATPALRAGMPALQSLAFEANDGQADAAVRFLARSGSHQLLLTSRSVILRSIRGSFGIEFAGASDSSRVEGREPLPGRRNYLLGNDPKNWHAGVPTFQKVLYRDLYPGIDLTFYGNQSEFEYDFIVKAGADPRTIRLQIDRATRARISSIGDLILKRGEVEVIQRKPQIYQEIDGKRRAVKGHYSLSRPHEIEFQIGRYDRTRP